MEFRAGRHARRATSADRSHVARVPPRASLHARTAHRCPQSSVAIALAAAVELRAGIVARRAARFVRTRPACATACGGGPARRGGRSGDLDVRTSS